MTPRKILAVVAAAAVGGLAIGTALAKLSGDGERSVGEASSQAGTSAALTRPSATPDTEARRTTTRRRSGVRVRIVSAILHPGSRPSSQRRGRARLSVHVRVTNRGTRRIVPPRPVLVSGDERIRTDPAQDAPSTSLAALAPGATQDVTLRFEIAGAVTQRAQQELRVRLIIASRYLTAAMKIGRSVRVARAGRPDSDPVLRSSSHLLSVVWRPLASSPPSFTLSRE